MEKPILFSAPMVNAILEGRKTQTRRVMTVQPPDWYNGHVDIASKDAFAVWLGETESQDESHGGELKFPYGNIGDSLWVRENFRFGTGYDNVKPSSVPKETYVKVWYEADGNAPHGFGFQRPSIFLPRYFSRLTLRITDIKVERLQDISAEDAVAEGSYLGKCSCFPKPRTPIESMMKQTWCHVHGNEFSDLWKNINGEESWKSNPFVWVISFERVQK